MLRLWQRDCVATARHLGKGSPTASAQARSCIRVVDLPVQSVADVMLADSPACSEGRAENAGDIRACKADIRELAIGHHRHLLHDCAPVSHSANLARSPRAHPRLRLTVAGM